MPSLVPLQLPGIASFIFPGVFYENLLPGSGMDPVKQEDGTFLLAQPAKNKVRVREGQQALCACLAAGGARVHGAPSTRI